MAAVPATIAAVSAGSSILDGVGEYKQYRAAAREDEYRAKVADANAVTTERQTTAAVGQQQRRAAETLGEQRASIAQSGFGSTGTMTDIARESGTASVLDAMNIRYEGNIKKQNFETEAEMSRWSAKQNRTAGKFALGSSMLLAPAKGYLGYASAGGTFGAKGAGVMKSSAIPKGLASANEAQNILNPPWWKGGT
jgi:hypothetical protein